MSTEMSPTKAGVLVPSANTTLERDAKVAFNSPEAVAHFSRVKIDTVSPDDVAGLVEHVPSATRLLADAKVEAIAFGCTGGSLIGGLGYDEKIIRMIEDIAGVPATTTSTALIEALRLMGIDSVALVTPYPTFMTEAVAEFLRLNDIAVEGVFGFGIADPIEIAAVEPARIAEAVRDVDSERIDAVFISCTSFRGVDTIELLGDGLNKPILSSNQVTYWKLAKMANLDILPASLRLGTTK